MGMALIEYPAAGANPAGVIAYKSTRLMFSSGSRWRQIETSAGVYSETELEKLDSIITAHRTNGASVIFGMDGTPLFYAQTGANPLVGDDVTKDPSGTLGAASFPTSLSAVTNFVQMIVARYNLAGGTWYDAHGAALGKGVQYWETGNEPALDALGNRATAPGQTIYGVNFWGTPAQLVDYMSTQYSAVKAIDPGVVVLSPGISNHAAENSYRDMDTCFNTRGSVTGKYGHETFDALAWHPYFTCPAGAKYGTLFSPWIGDMATGPLGVTNIVQWMRARGFPHQAHATEWGIDSAHATASVTAWLAESADFRYRWIARTFMTAAAGGMASIHPWRWDVVGANALAGDYQNDVGGAQRAYNDCAAMLSGKTIVGGGYTPNGKVRLEFADGSEWEV
jgi:hypothetical protein